jgi:hypothetical protein
MIILRIMDGDVEAMMRIIDIHLKYPYTENMTGWHDA